MRLERLEINGFKSFSDRSELAFDKGVTAIVGPNGCGKSNVADAITWVMGEQSAKSLRGEKMEDVIFNGSDARKPTAAAEVRLRFSGFLKTVSGPAFPAEPGLAPADNGHAGGNGHGNGNGHHATEAGNGHGPVIADVVGIHEIIQSVAREIEVTRRLYRSGESEYLIDGTVCRLRDVHDLLMDTGLGAKNYAIIEQGKIGMILSTRPTDRRQLIEEAAGVTKYKARRRAAELKLEAAQQNLTRIDDIVFEVEKQRGTLKRQAGRAKRYQRLRDELRRWEKVLFARKYRQLAETIESARARLTDAREREAVSAGRVGEVEADLGRLRIELVEAESQSTRIAGGRARAGIGDHAPRATDRLRSRAGPGARRANRQRHRRAPGTGSASRAGPRSARGAPDRRRRGQRRSRKGIGHAGVGIGCVRRGPAGARGAGSRRRGCARRSLLGTELGDRPPSCIGARGGRSRSCRRGALEARRRGQRRPDRVRARGGGTRGGGRRAAPCPRGDRRDADCAGGSRVRVGERALSSTNGGRDRFALASTSSRASPRG